MVLVMTKRKCFILILPLVVIFVVVTRVMEMKITVSTQTTGVATYEVAAQRNRSAILYIPTSSGVIERQVIQSIHETGISMAELNEKLRRRVHVSVKKSSECSQVHDNSASFWRSVTTGAMTHQQDLVRMNLAARCGAFNHTELIAYNPRDPPFPWELEYLSDPPLRDLMNTVSTEKSSIEVLNSTATIFHVGDKVMFKVVLRTVRGEIRRKGGDSVRLWLVNSELNASTVADVIDNKDGSYLASSLLPWSGQVQVKATIAHSRELFRAVLFVQRIFKSTHSFTGTFSNYQASESTPCSPFPAIPAFPASEVCNLTNANGGYPWYCGKPVKHHMLNCSNWISVRKLNMPSDIPLTEAEEKVIRLTETQRPFLISSNITLSVKPSTGDHMLLQEPALACSQRNLSLTFNDTNQSGYFFNNTWRPYECHLPTVDNEFLSKCLQNTKFIIIGDSNSRLQMVILSKTVSCVHKIPRTKVVWHAPLQCDNDTIGMSIKYFPPKHPFYGSVNEDMKNTVLYSAIKILDDIPATGNYLIHLHEFLHIVPSHLSVSEHRFRLVRAAIERLLARNSRVHVIYQSVHTAYDRTPLNKHKLNVFLLELQRRFFGGLGDRVMFALTLPMTIAVENTDGHPPISNQFTRLYMGYVCGRW